ncbi:MAG: M23 family metallopeptidase [Ferruginibacter sp.]
MKKIILLLLLIIIGILVYWSLDSKVSENVDTYVYNLPFKEGTSRFVVQGYGSLFSHKNKAALDFYMPVGTPVYAAREGTIFSYKDDSNEGGPFTSYEKKANYIIIKHPDGSFGCYWHLQLHGVVVKEGSVAKGQLIGYSGKTGFALWPHLHFAVKLKLNYEKDSFIKTKFATTKGIQFLKNGRKYERPL